MAKVSAIPQEGPEFDAALDIVNAMAVLGDHERPTLNYTKLVDTDGRVWYGYDYSGASWWISSCAPDKVSSFSDPYDFHEQGDPGN